MSAILDPFEDYHASVNLDRECWDSFQKDPATLKIVDEVRIILNQGMVAAVPKERLFEIGFDVAASLGKHYVFLQERSHDHWAAIAICMMSKAYIEIFSTNDLEKSDPSIRFYRSDSLRDESLYVLKIKGLMKQVQVKNKSYYMWVPKEPVPVTPKEPQLSLF